MEEKEKDPVANGGFTEWLSKTWEKFNVFSRIEKGDTPFVIAGKITVRALGFIILLALSPLILFGFFVAFIAVT